MDFHECKKLLFIFNLLLTGELVPSEGHPPGHSS